MSDDSASISRYIRFKLSNKNKELSGENHAIAIAGPSQATRASSSYSRPQTQTKMFKLNVHCFEHLFEWFSLKELLVFRCTCKRIQKVVDYYIKLNYSRVRLVQLRTHPFIPSRKYICPEFLEICRTRLSYFE